MDGRKIIQWWLGGLAIIAIVGYSFFVIDDFVRGPRIIIDTPKNGYSTTTPVIVVSGHGIHTNNLSINGMQTPVDLEGSFRAQLILAPGYNIIKVTAKDNYERTVEKTIEMVLKEEQLTTDTSTQTSDKNAYASTTGTTTQATTIINQY